MTVYNLTPQSPEISYDFNGALSNAWKVLLEEKNLYQSITVDTESIKVKLVELFKEVRLQRSGRISAVVKGSEIHDDTEERMASYFLNFTHSQWVLAPEYGTQPKMRFSVTASTDEPLVCRLPTIHINCKHCTSVLPPHNSGFPGIGGVVSSYDFGNHGKGVVQVFSVPYLCQSCKKEPIVFQVRREGIKLTLVGRSNLYVPTISKAIPSEESEYLRGALIASTTGNLLPALFMLRVFVEQYMRRVAKVTGRIRGEDLADEYARYLPDGFPSSLRSLKNIYEAVSECLHGANPSRDIFDKCVKDVETHFDQLKILPLKTEV